MKFVVLILTVFLSAIKCIACKGWINASYKDEDDYALRWSGHLKRLALITFMLSGLILYCVPDTRFYFCRACHGMIDFVADGLKTALNPNDTEYLSDDSSSIYSEQESEQIFEKRSSCLSNDVLAKNHLVNAYIEPRCSRIYMNSDDSNDIDTSRRNCVERSKGNRNEDRFHCQIEQKPNNHSLGKFTKNEYSLELPFETIQIYPAQIIDVRNFTRSKYFCSSGRDSDSARAVCLREKGHKILYATDEDNSGPESEPTQCPDEKSIHENTSDVERLNSYLNIKEEIERSLKTRKILEKRLLDFDRTLRNLCCSLLQKNSTRNEKRNKYTVQLMETILQSVKSNCEDVVEREKNENKRIYRKLKGTRKTSTNETAKKLSTSKYKNRKWDEKTVKTERRRNLSPVNSLVKKIVYRDYKKNTDHASLSLSSFSLVPEKLLQLPIIPDCVKPMIECAVRWLCGRCSSIETEKSTVGKMESKE